MSLQEPSFEEILSQLESVVGTLERGGLTLEQALELFERGMKLAKECGNRLDQAEMRVREIRSFLSEEES